MVKPSTEFENTVMDPKSRNEDRQENRQLLCQEAKVYLFIIQSVFSWGNKC